MTGELIPTGVTFGVGRNSINDAFSGTAEFNNISLDTGGDFSGGTGGGALLSGGTNLYDIFGAGGGDITRVQPGTNMSTGGTANEPTVSLVDSPSVNGFTASGTSNFTGTIQSGGTDLYNIFCIDCDSVPTGGTATSDIIYDLGSSYQFKITGDQSSYEQIILESNFSTSQPARLTVGRAVAEIRSENTPVNVISYLRTDGGTARIFRSITGLEQSFVLNSSDEMLITDNINSKGMQYNANYHGNYDNRTLVDKEYVDNVVASGATATTVSAVHDFGTTSGVIDWDLDATSVNAKVILSGNITSLNVLNATSGVYGTLLVEQGGVGGYTIALGTGTHRVVNSGGGSVTLTASVGAIDILTFFYDGSNFNWNVGNNYT